MAQRLEIALKPELKDPAGQGLTAKVKTYLGIGLSRARVLRVLTFDTSLSPQDLERVRNQIFTNPVTEISSFEPLAGQVLPDFDWVLWVGLRPGVRDNEGSTAVEAMADVLGRKFGPNEAVYSSRLYLVKAPRLSRAQAEAICRELLANPIVQNYRVTPRDEWDAAQGMGIVLPKVEMAHTPQVLSLSVASDQELIRLSDERNLFLNPADVPVIRAYFNDSGVLGQRASVGLKEPTDVELEYVSQARSDHCNHNTFNGLFRYHDAATGEEKVVNNLFKRCIKEPTERLAAENDWVVSVLWDNAGIARLDDKNNYVITGETHNSPSNMEAYGGAITGIVGVYRDPMGTGLGSKLVAGMWGFCVGPRDYDGELKPVLHPRRLLDGIVEGVRDGGNKSGIPTALGLLYFDERYLGKCLVFVSALGVMPHEIKGRPSHEKTTSPGELVVMCGGRVGADGIHGVTAASASYSEHTPAGHVQIGDPYTQKKMHDFLLEARDQGLIPFITDNGGGGLSSSVGESARFSNGAEVDLKKVPLKYEGLDPWQIWVSESQERMTVSVKPTDIDAFMALAEKHNVESTIIGRYTGDGKLKLSYGDQVCAYVDVAFLEKGFPQWEFEADWLPPALRGLAEPVLGEPGDLGALLLDVLHTPNLSSHGWINRQYDHEVQGSSVVKPFVGRGFDVPADAAVLHPVLESKAGLAMSQVLLTAYGDIDTYHMVTASVEEGMRRVVAVGADPGQVGGVDNFCWPSIEKDERKNPDAPYKAAQLVRACWGLKDACEALKIPLLSGKDSMYVDGTLKRRHGMTQRVSGPPTMMFTATAPVPDLKRVQTLEPKMKDDLLYVVGLTKDELGGSAVYNMLGHVGANVPQTDFDQSLKLFDAIHEALGRGLLASCCAISRGGLAYALSRMAMAANLGLIIDLDQMPAVPGMSPMGLMFSESTGRMAVTVDPKKQEEFESLLGDIAWGAVGRVAGDKRLKIGAGGRTVCDLAVSHLRRAFTKNFGNLI